MAESTGLILTAAGIAAANELVFAPISEGKPLWIDFNWRLIPATALAALTLGVLENLSPQLAKGLAGLALLAVIILPVGNAPSPVENASKTLGLLK